MVARSLLTVLMLTASAMFFAPFASAQGSDTVFDEAGTLSAAEERDVQAAFNQASAESGDPLYAFLESDTNVAGDNLNAQHEFLLDRVQQADLPANAGVIVVAPDERWSQVQNLSGNTEQDVYGAMVPYFQDGDFTQGLVAGATQYQDSLNVLPELLTTGGVLAALTALAGGALLLFNRRRKERELEEQRRLVEREFAALTERMDAFGEKERLVAGYLEAQRPLLDQKNEEEVEAKIRDARSAGFGREFNEAASHLASDPRSAREKIANGRRLLDNALSNLVEAESTINQYRAADEALEGMLRVAAEEIDAAETAERSARETGASVEYQDLRRKYDRLAKETANRTGRRDEFDPRETLAAVGALIEKARDRRTEMEAEVSARATLPEERSSAKDALLRARETLEEYARAYATATNGWGPAALEEAPPPKNYPRTFATHPAASSAPGRRRRPDASSRRVPSWRALRRRPGPLCRPPARSRRSWRRQTGAGARARRSSRSSKPAWSTRRPIGTGWARARSASSGSTSAGSTTRAAASSGPTGSPPCWSSRPSTMTTCTWTAPAGISVPEAGPTAATGAEEIGGATSAAGPSPAGTSAAVSEFS
jgi:hypothetical protein